MLIFSVFIKSDKPVWMKKSRKKINLNEKKQGLY